MNDAAGARAAAQATAAAAPAGSPGAAAAATGDPPADAGAGPGAKPGADRHADAAWRALHAAASAPYRRVGRFAWHFARGKLGRDPVFRALLERGDLAGRRRIVDIGCGQGLLASLLRACGALRQAGGWPAAWPSAPAATAYTGIELMPRDVARAERALSTAAAAHAALRPLPPAEAVGRGRRSGVEPPAASPPSGPGPRAGTRTASEGEGRGRAPPALTPARSRPEREQDAPLVPRFIRGDMCTTPLPRCDAVVILDVLHYVPHAAQTELLARVRDALRPHGRLLLRVGDASADRPFAVSQWVDRLVTWTRGHRAAPTWGRPLADWQALLNEIGFAPARRVPMSQGTPFANVLLVADVADVTDVTDVTDVANAADLSGLTDAADVTDMTGVAGIATSATTRPAEPPT